MAGSNSSISVRGSFNDPLYVIDGIVEDKATFNAAINPNGSEMPITQAQRIAANYQLTAANFKYVLRRVPISGVIVNTVPDSYYFASIQQIVIFRDKNIQQNIGWGSTFDPTIH